MSTVGPTPTKSLNQGNSKATESVGKNGCRQKRLDKSLTFSVEKTQQSKSISVTLIPDKSRRVSIQVLSTEQFNVALHILYLIKQDSLFPVIESSFYTINFYHSLLNLETPCNSPVVINMLEAAKRVEHQKTHKRKL